MNLDSFVENPGEQINSSQKATLKLYFSNKAGTRLVPETREVHYSSNISLEKLVMEQLIEIEKRTLGNDSFGDETDYDHSGGWGLLCQSG